MKNTIFSATGSHRTMALTFVIPSVAEDLQFCGPFWNVFDRA